MLKQFAPSARMPPSPKKKAWMTSAIDIAMVAISGPRMMAASAPPTAWAVVPPGIGTLNIMMINEKAAIKAIKGTFLADIFSRNFRTPMTQNGRTIMNMMIEVSGLRYPSGMCMAVVTSQAAKMP